MPPARHGPTGPDRRRDDPRHRPVSPLPRRRPGPRLGELDEEFVLERRVGETFILGTATWKIESIEAQKVVVSRAAGQAAMMPFWRGEKASRTAELGEKVGVLCRELAEKRQDPGVLAWLASECRLDPIAATALRDHVIRQVRVAGAVPDDRTVLVETFTDPAGELGLAVLSPLGGKLHLALKLALQGRLRQRLGITLACLHSDDGLLIRLPKTIDRPPLDLFDGLTPELAEELIRLELGDSALFGLRFRQNAGRALLMPRPDPSKRTPLWLQRLRAKDLLQVVRKLPDFPIVVETYRECLVDDLDIPRLRAFLKAIGDGSIRVVTREGEVSSPFASDLIFRFTSTFLYQWDEPARDPKPGGDPVDAALLDSLLEPAAIGRVEARLRSTGHPPRTVDEMAEELRRLGDLAPSDLAGPMAGFLADLEVQGRAIRIEIAGAVEPSRFIGDEEASLYAEAFGGPESDPAIATIVRRYLRTHALVGLDDLTARYPIGPALATDLLERFAGRSPDRAPCRGQVPQLPRGDRLARLPLPGRPPRLPPPDARDPPQAGLLALRDLADLQPARVRRHDPGGDGSRTHRRDSERRRRPRLPRPGAGAGPRPQGPRRLSRRRSPPRLPGGHGGECRGGPTLSERRVPTVEDLV